MTVNLQMLSLVAGLTAGERKDADQEAEKLALRDIRKPRIEDYQSDSSELPQDAERLMVRAIIAASIFVGLISAVKLFQMGYDSLPDNYHPLIKIAIGISTVFAGELYVFVFNLALTLPLDQRDIWVKKVFWWGIWIAAIFTLSANLFYTEPWNYHFLNDGGAWMWVFSVFPVLLFVIGGVGIEKYSLFKIKTHQKAQVNYDKDIQKYRESVAQIKGTSEYRQLRADIYLEKIIEKNLNLKGRPATNVSKKDFVNYLNNLTLDERRMLADEEFGSESWYIDKNYTGGISTRETDPLSETPVLDRRMTQPWGKREEENA